MAEKLLKVGEAKVVLTASRSAVAPAGLNGTVGVDSEPHPLSASAAAVSVKRDRFANCRTCMGSASAGRRPLVAGVTCFRGTIGAGGSAAGPDSAAGTGNGYAKVCIFSSLGSTGQPCSCQ